MLVKRTLSPLGVESHGGPSPREATGAMQLLSYTQAPGSGVTLVFLPLVRADGACASFPSTPLRSLDTEDTCGVLFIPADQDLALLRPPQNLRAPQAHRGDLCLRGPGAAMCSSLLRLQGTLDPQRGAPSGSAPRETNLHLSHIQYFSTSNARTVLVQPSLGGGSQHQTQVPQPGGGIGSPA